MQIVKHPKELREICDSIRLGGKTVSFVPTMGALHDGHLQLVHIAQTLGDVVIVSIFVNPTQFGPNEDFEKYPRDMDGDRAKLEGLGVDIIFAPKASVMYPKGAVTSVIVDDITSGFCGAHRPNHFKGVSTVVTKLFNIVGPCAAIFGKKDYQQLQVIKRLVNDLNMPIKIVGVPTVRERDGLAMSSRNAYLSDEERNRALSLSKGLNEAHRLYNDGERDAQVLKNAVLDTVFPCADSVDYVEISHPHTLQHLIGVQPTSATMLIAIAVKIGNTRLIDNTVLGEDSSPLPKPIPG